MNDEMKQKMIYDLALEYTRGQGQFSGSAKLSGSYATFVNSEMTDKTVAPRLSFMMLFSKYNHIILYFLYP